MHKDQIIAVSIINPALLLNIMVPLLSWKQRLRHARKRNVNIELQYRKLVRKLPLASLVKKCAFETQSRGITERGRSLISNKQTYFFFLAQRSTDDDLP